MNNLKKFIMGFLIFPIFISIIWGVIYLCEMILPMYGFPILGLFTVSVALGITFVMFEPE